jgi:cyclopropane fatty-acyl-phospholipid synthase-like methyltransferase
MNAAELHAQLLQDSPVLPDAQPYGVAAFGGDIPDNPLCALTAATLEDLAPTIPFKQALEIGAGAGRWSRWLRPRCESLVCVDRTSASKKHIDALNLTPAIMHLLCPWGALPTGPGSPLHQAFDLVFSYDTFVHFDKVLIQTYLRSIAQALAPGALAVLHVASEEHKQPHQPTDHSGNWCPINDTLFNTLTQAQGMRTIHQIRAVDGFGSRVCFLRKS